MPLFSKPLLKEYADGFFDISKHLEKVKDLLNLHKEENLIDHKNGTLNDMIYKMLSPSIIENLPLSDIVLQPEDLDDLKNIRGKITITIGHQEDDEPMEIKKKVIKFKDKDEEIKEDGKLDDEVVDKEEAFGEDKDIEIISNLENKAKKIANQIYTTNKRFASFVDIKDYLNQLRIGYDTLNKIAYNSDSDNLIKKALSSINPSKFSSKLDNDTYYIINSVINDISLCPDYSLETYKQLAERVKFAYHNLLSSSMTKKAYLELKEEDSNNDKFNICPKYKTVKGSGVPVPWGFCERECIEGKVNDNGSVSCKYSNWLENVADSHVKAMSKLDEHVNPVNEDTNLRLKDGEKSHPDRGYSKSNEKRLEESGIRGREWDDLKRSKGKAPGKVLNYESLIDEILTKKDIHRDDTGHDENTEKKLRGNKFSTKVESTEKRLYNNKQEKKQDDKNVESKLNPINKIYVDKEKIMDELLEEAYPRKDEKRPKK